MLLHKNKNRHQPTYIKTHTNSNLYERGERIILLDNGELVIGPRF